MSLEVSEVQVTRELMRNPYYRKLCRLVDRLSIHRPEHHAARERALTIKIRLYSLKRHDLFRHHSGATALPADLALLDPVGP